jgi:hypothetical protein
MADALKTGFLMTTLAIAAAQPNTYSSSGM